MTTVSDRRELRGRRPIRLDAVGAVAAGLAVGLELGLLAVYFHLVSNLVAACALGVACALLVGLSFYFKGIPVPRRRR